MGQAEERRKILEMVAAGAIEASEAAELIAAARQSQSADESENGEPPEVPVSELAAGEPVAKDIAKKEEASAEKTPVAEKAARGGNGRWLHIRVSDLKSGRSKVSVNIPLRLVKFGLRLGRSYSPDLDELEWGDLDQLLASGKTGTLLEVEDDEDGEHVQIYVD